MSLSLSAGLFPHLPAPLTAQWTATADDVLVPLSSRLHLSCDNPLAGSGDANLTAAHLRQSTVPVRLVINNSLLSIFLACLPPIFTERHTRGPKVIFSGQLLLLPMLVDSFSVQSAVSIIMNIANGKVEWHFSCVSLAINGLSCLLLPFLQLALIYWQK